MLESNMRISEKRHDLIIGLLKGIKTHLEEQNILQKEILEFKEACKYLCISDSLLYKLSANGKIQTHKPNGRKLYFLKKDLDNWILNKSNHLSEIDSEQFVKEKLKELNSFNHD